MKIFSLIFSLTLLVWIFPARAEDFLPGTEDIPLMEGLEQVEEDASFDAPEERMVLVNARTTLPPARVALFYRRALRNLGWKEIKQNQFERGSDSFTINIMPRGRISQIQFRLSQENK